MKSKIMAVVLAVAMAVAAVAIVASDDSNAADQPIPKGTVYVGVGESVKVEFNITEPDKGYYSNTVSWASGDTPITSAETGISSGETQIINIKIDGSKGSYTATIKGVAAGSLTKMPIKYTCVTEIRGNDSAGTVTQTLSYTIDVNVVGSPLKAVSGEGSFSLSGTEGTAIGTGTTVTNETGTFEYVYYAVGLPKGVQMNPQGTITGTPVDDGTDTFTVIATHKASNMSFKETYNYSIEAKQASVDGEDFTFTVQGAEVSDDGKYVVASNGSVTVVTKVGDAATTITGFELINTTTGTNTPVTANTTGTYVIDSTNTSGSGSYIVVMTCGDFVKQFELVVVANSVDIDTGIGFNPGSS